MAIDNHDLATSFIVRLTRRGTPAARAPWLSTW